MATDMLTWARRQVFEPLSLSSSERFVLLLLADNASWNEETGGWYAFPFQKTLARESGLSERTVRRAMNRLLELGVISAERRRRASGFVAGNGYIFHPEITENPVTLTAKDAVEPSEGLNDGPGFSGGDTMSSLEIAGEDTVTGPGIAGEDTMSSTPHDRHDPKTGHSDRRTPCPLGPDTVTGPARADRENVRARLNRHSESSSSSAGEQAAGAASDEDDEETPSGDSESADDCRSERAGLGMWRGVDLNALTVHVHAMTGLDCGRAELEWLTSVIIDRSQRRVGRPANFVRAAVANDPDGTRAELVARFGRTTPAASGETGAAGRTVSPPCPIPEHAEEGLLKVNCPACRGIWGESFPAQISAEVFDLLDAAVQERVLGAEGVAIVDDGAGKASA